MIIYKLVSYFRIALLDFERLVARLTKRACIIIINIWEQKQVIKVDRDSVRTAHPAAPGSIPQRFQILFREKYSMLLS